MAKNPSIKIESEAGADIVSAMDSPKDKEFKDRLAALKEHHDAAVKEIEAERAEYRALRELEVWKDLTEMKRSFQKELNKVPGWKLKKLSNMMEYYTYQHPTKKQLKADKESEQWVESFLSNGGKLTTLIETADKSRLATWQRINGKKKRKKKSTTSAGGDSNTGDKNKGKDAGSISTGSTSNASRVGL